MNPFIANHKRFTSKFQEIKMKNTLFFPRSKSSIKHFSTVALCTSLFLLSGCGSSSSSSSDSDNANNTDAGSIAKTFAIQVGSDLNSKSNPLLSLNSGGPGGSSNQSLRAGDILYGNENDDLLIGGLGVDVLFGEAGDDILIGGTEDFNSSVDGDELGSDNRDRAFGQEGNDLFVWTPGDGSDFFDGGEGIDVVVFGIVGELRDAKGLSLGAPFFNVNPGGEGSKDFDGIYTDENGQPKIRVSNTPGYCSFVDTQVYADELAELELDQIVRFTIRNIANAFDAGERSDDDGLRVAVSLKNTEYVVCTRRDFDEEAGLNNVTVLKISSGIPVAADISDLPEYIQALIQ
jgi:hypothetical protein